MVSGARFRPPGLAIDYHEGWALREFAGPNNAWPDKMKQGTWTLNWSADEHGRLDIEAPDGHLLF